MHLTATTAKVALSRRYSPSDDAARMEPGATAAGFDFLSPATNFLEIPQAGFHYSVSGEFATVSLVYGFTGDSPLIAEVATSKSGVAVNRARIGSRPSACSDRHD